MLQYFCSVLVHVFFRFVSHQFLCALQNDPSRCQFVPIRQMKRRRTTSGGIRMEMVPMRAQAIAGQVVNFVCAYFSMERLEIDIQPIGHKHIDGKMLPTSAQHSVSNALMLGPPVRDMLDRFPWGSRRSLSLLIDATHRQVKCRVTNADGLILGELTALIQPPGSLSITKTKEKHFFFLLFRAKT